MKLVNKILQPHIGSHWCWFPLLCLFCFQRRFLLVAASPAHNSSPSGAAFVSPQCLVSAKSERSMTGTGAGLPKKKVNAVAVAWANKLCLVFGVWPCSWWWQQVWKMDLCQVWLRWKPFCRNALTRVTNRAPLCCSWKGWTRTISFCLLHLNTEIFWATFTSQSTDQCWFLCASGEEI